MTSKAINNPELECSRLCEFRKFLNTNASNVTIEDTTKACLTRANNETYPVTLEESLPEILKASLAHLRTKGCPSYFQIELLRHALDEFKKELIDEFGEVEDFDLLKLQKFVVNNLEKVLISLADNIAADQIASFADPGALCEGGGQCQCELTPVPIYAVSCVKNKPRKMEDRHICLDRYSDLYDLSTFHSCSLYGVFDGHSGTQSATYSASQLPYLLAEQLRQRVGAAKPTVDHFRAAFENAFLLADERVRRKKFNSGTTAVCTLIVNERDGARHLYTAWVGDSKALLVGACANLQLVKPHRPNNLEERKRIEASGGSVIFVGGWRVNGILNVARSIGDFSMDAVTAEPDFVDVVLSTAHDYLVIGTDGLWDHVSDADVSEITYNALCNDTLKLEDIPKLLIEAAKDGGSQDNITVIIVLLKTRAEIIQSSVNINKKHATQQS